MQRSIATVSLSGTLPEKLEAIAAAGFDGVEIFENDLLYYDGSPREIKQMCADAGIKTSFNKRCKDCYKDALLLLKLHYGVTIPDSDIVTPSGHFVYHNGLKKILKLFLSFGERLVSGKAYAFRSTIIL